MIAPEVLGWGVAGVCFCKNHRPFWCLLCPDLRSLVHTVTPHKVAWAETWKSSFLFLFLTSYIKLLCSDFKWSSQKFFLPLHFHTHCLESSPSDFFPGLLVHSSCLSSASFLTLPVQSPNCDESNHDTHVGLRPLWHTPLCVLSLWLCAWHIDVSPLTLPSLVSFTLMSPHFFLLLVSQVLITLDFRVLNYTRFSYLSCIYMFSLLHLSLSTLHASSCSSRSLLQLMLFWNFFLLLPPIHLSQHNWLPLIIKPYHSQSLPFPPFKEMPPAGYFWRIQWDLQVHSSLKPSSHLPCSQSVYSQTHGKSLALLAKERLES